METSLIFVYGTLLSGERNHAYLEGSQYAGPARTTAAFELVDLGSYPALVRGGGTAIAGELYVCDVAVRRRLDELEGHPYFFQRSPVVLDDGRQVEAYVLGRRHVERAPVIRSGSFRALGRALVAFLFLVGICSQARAERHRDAGADADKHRDAASLVISASGAAEGPSASAATETAFPTLPDASAEASPETAADASSSVVPASAITEPGAIVRLREAKLFSIKSARGSRTAEERAQAATQALQKAAEANEARTVRVEEQNDGATIYVGERPIIELGKEDALAAGDVSVRVHAESIASRIRDGLQVEEHRTSLVKTGITLLAVLLSGIFALFLLRRVGRLSRTTRTFIEEQPERVPTLMVQSIEIVRPSTLRVFLGGSVRVLAIILQVGIVYGWLLFALYIFEPTREYTGRLTEIAWTPLTGLMSKMAGSVPVLITAAVSIAALILLVRFVGAFFDSAAKGETAIGWVPPDLVGTTSIVVRFAIVVLFLVVAIPFITGNEDTSLARIGLVPLVALGMASTPILASMCVGLSVVYGRGLRLGDFASFGPHAGRIESITLVDVRLRDREGCEIRVPHLLSLFNPTRVLGKARPVSATITVSTATSQPAVRELLAGVAAKVGTDPRVQLVSLDSSGACYRVSVRSEGAEAEHQLYLALCDALFERSVPLGTLPSKTD